ncbi:MAG: hypothetical protein LBT16_13420 [Treponema sp.]|nr:hypothetical protein [Treponema sp.]
MNKFVSFAFISIICCTWSVFAEDARALPARVGSFSLVPNFDFAPGSFDGNWQYSQYTGDGEEGALKAGNLGAALEYGILNWLTFSAEWVPGWTFWSEVDAQTGTSDKLNINGVYDLFMGLSVQLLGPKAPLQTSHVRLLLTPVVKIPLPGTDFRKQAGKAGEGEETTIANPDKHVFGFGPRASLDVVFNNWFFINVYGEYIYYPLEKKASDTSLAYYESASSRQGDFDIDYRYGLNFELEPVLTFPLSEGIAVTVGLPLNYKISPDMRYNTETVPGSGSSLLTVKPKISLFVTGLFVPAEVELSYMAPLMGRNTRALNTVSLLVKLYFKI